MKLTSCRRLSSVVWSGRVPLQVLCILTLIVAQADAGRFLVIPRKKLVSTQAATADLAMAATAVQQSKTVEDLRKNRKAYTKLLDERFSELKVQAATAAELHQKKFPRASVQHVALTAANMIAVNADSEDEVKAVYSDDEWEIVEGQDFEIYQPPVSVGAASVATAASGLPWGIDRVNAQKVWAQFNTRGEGVVVAVIDSGVNASHSELRGRVEVSRGKSFVTAESGTDDLNGHGTHVSGTVAGTNFGVAPKSTIVPVKVLGADGSGNETSVIAGINFAVIQNVDVINLSLRTPFNPARNGSGTRIDELYQDALDKAEKAGIVVVAAAGNDALQGLPIGQPGRRGNVITVAALTQSNARADFSQRGDVSPEPNPVKPDIAAPGVNIESADRNGKTSIKNGTSMASPHVAGTVALMLASTAGDTGQAGTLERVRSAIKTSAKSLNDVEAAVGQGLLDALGAVQKFAGVAPPPPPPPPYTLIDIAEVEKKHKEQMKVLASIGSDLESNLKRLRDLEKPGQDEEIQDSFDELENALDEVLGEGNVEAGAAGAAATGTAVSRSDLVKVGLLIEKRMTQRLDARSKDLDEKIDRLGSQIEKLEKLGKTLEFFDREIRKGFGPGGFPFGNPGTAPPAPTTAP